MTSIVCYLSAGHECPNAFGRQHTLAPELGNTYDQVGRRLTVSEQIAGSNGVAQGAIYLSLANYNQIGQLSSKNIGGSTTSGYAANVTLGSANSVSSGTVSVTATNSIVMQPDFYVSPGATFSAQIGGYLQTIVYKYNERGWLVSLTPAITSSYGGNYAEQLYYNNPAGTATPQYNGNIAQFVYNSPYMETGNGQPSNSTNTVNYTYDNLNRLTQSQSTLGKTDETIAYDPEGNISSLVRSGTGVNTGTLAYTYTSGTNRLASVTENGTAFKQFTYDGNGNAKSDSTTKSLTYNMLNLPLVYTLNGVTKATYYYDADGNKLRNVSSTYGTWDYVDGIVYQNERVDFIQTEEGQAVLEADSTYHYTYDLLDYIGSVRETFDNGGTGGAIQTLQENDYYPFGLTIKAYDNSNNNRYLYNKKEEQLDLTNQYDYGARFYDPVIARWNTIDPLAEKSRRWSTYNYVEDNPITRIDPDGMDDYTMNKNGDINKSSDTKDKTDRIVKTDKNGKILRKGEGFLGFLVGKEHRGEAKTAIGGVEKGILKNGINFQKSNNVIDVGGKGQPSLAGVESFALNLSNYTDKEIRGFEVSDKGQTDISHVLFDRYEDNTATHSIGGFNLNSAGRSDLIGKVDPQYDFHTHLSRFGDSDRLVPSGSRGEGGGDMETKRQELSIDPALKFKIITNPSSFEY